MLVKVVIFVLFIFINSYYFPDTEQDIIYLKEQIVKLQVMVDRLTKNHVNKPKIDYNRVSDKRNSQNFIKPKEKQNLLNENVLVRNTKRVVNENIAVPDIKYLTSGKFNVSGFVELIALHDFDQVGYDFNRDYTYVPQLKYKDQGDIGLIRKSTRMHVKQSRIVMSYKKDAKFWHQNYPVMIFLDIDFYNGKEGNGIFTHSFQPRMRNACVDIGGLKVGLFWSLFMDQANYPITLDFGSDTGLSLLRQPQIRYVHKINNIWSVGGSIENSDSTFVDKEGRGSFTRTLDNSSGDIRSNSILPDFILALMYNKDGWDGGIKGVINNTRVYTNSSKHATVYGLGFGTSTSYSFPNRDKIIAHFNIGKGIGRYLHDAAQYGYYYDKDLNKLYRHFAFGYTLGITHFWRTDLHSSISFGQTRIRLHKNILEQDIGENNPVEDNFFSYCTSLHLNLIWNLTKDIELGVEYLNLRKAPVRFDHPRKNDRKKATLDRIIFSFKVNFG